ncbi:MAG: hypothetical protein JWP75_1280 [Frondihabitans sp.]|nr:hypothetical protein [Frondihabitans sp.]
MIPFHRKRDGIHVTLAPHEQALVRDLATQLITLLGEGDRTDAALSRLLPPGYSGDEEADAEFRRLTTDDLTAGKIANARTVLSTLGDKKEPLDAAGEQAWLRSLTDIRLTLGARLGVTADGFPPTRDQQVLMQHRVYDWLGFVQEVFVRALDR